jgi:hypothetical protein
MTRFHGSFLCQRWGLLLQQLLQALSTAAGPLPRGQPSLLGMLEGGQRSSLPCSRSALWSPLVLRLRLFSLHRMSLPLPFTSHRPGAVPLNGRPSAPPSGLAEDLAQ